MDAAIPYRTAYLQLPVTVATASGYVTARTRDPLNNRDIQFLKSLLLLLICFLFPAPCHPSLTLLGFSDKHAEFLQVECLTVEALVNVTVPRYAPLTADCTLLHPDEQTHVKVNSQTDERLDLLSVLVGHRVNRKEYHSESLLVAVSFSQGSSTVLVEADVGFACAEHGHVCESDAEEPVIGQTRDG